MEHVKLELESEVESLKALVLQEQEARRVQVQSHLDVMTANVESERQARDILNIQFAAECNALRCEMESEREALKSELSAMQATMDSRRQARDVLTSKMDAECYALKSELTATQATMDSERHARDDREREVDLERDALKSELSAMQATMDSERQASDVLKSEMDAERDALKSELTATQAMMDSERHARDVREREVDYVREREVDLERDALKSELSAMQATMDSERQARDVLTSEMDAEHDALKSEMTAMHTTMESDKQARNVLTSKMAAERDTLRCELTTMHATMESERQARDVQAIEMTAQMADAVQEAVMQQAEIHKGAMKKMAAKYSDKVEELRKVVENQRLQQEDDKSMSMDAQQIMSQSLAQARKESDKLKGELEKGVKDHERMCSELEAERAGRWAEREEAKSERVEKEELTRRVADTAVKIEVLEHKVLEAHDNTQRQTGALVTLTVCLKDARLEVASAIVEAADAAQNTIRLEEQLEQERSDNTELHHIENSMQDHMTLLSSERDEARGQVYIYMYLCMYLFM